jgi:hypothetical protein
MSVLPPQRLPPVASHSHRSRMEWRHLRRQLRTHPHKPTPPRPRVLGPLFRPVHLLPHRHQPVGASSVPSGLCFLRLVSVFSFLLGLDHLSRIRICKLAISWVSRYAGIKTRIHGRPQSRRLQRCGAIDQTRTLFPPLSRHQHVHLQNARGPRPFGTAHDALDTGSCAKLLTCYTGSLLHFNQQINNHGVACTARI